jgi:hypothetical protein
VHDVAPSGALTVPDSGPANRFSPDQNTNHNNAVKTVRLRNLMNLSELNFLQTEWKDQSDFQSTAFS